MTDPISNEKQSANRPSAETTAALNKIREQHGIVSTDYSDVLSAFTNDKDVNGNYVTLTQHAIKMLAVSYMNNSEIRWSDTLTEEQISKNPLWRFTKNTGTRESRERFGKAYKLVDTGNYGLIANALYDIAGGADTGGKNFPIYPADFQYMANGPSVSSQKEDTPGSGFSIAIKEIQDSVKEESIYFDLLNAASYTLFTEGVQIAGKKVFGSYFTETVLPSLTSDDYQRYRRSASDPANFQGSEEIRQAVEYYYHKEIFTVAFLSGQTAARVNIERQAAVLSTLLADYLNNKSNPRTNSYFDTELFPYALTRMRLAIASSSNSLVKSAAAATQTVIDLLAINDERGVAGISNTSADIQTLFVVLTGQFYSGNSAGVRLSDNQIDEAVDHAVASGLKFKDVSTKGKLTTALKNLNNSGLLGAIGFFLSATRAVYDTMNLQFAELNGKATPSQIISLVGRYFSVYSGIGNLATLLKALNTPTRKLLLATANALRFDQVSSALWGATGTYANGINLERSIELTAFEAADQAIARNFAELPFAEESNFIESFFKKELQTTTRNMPAQTASQSENLVEVAINKTSEEIEIATSKAVSRTEASFGVKAFSISTSLAGLAADTLFLAADIVAAVNASTITESQILALTSDIFSLSSSSISLGVAYEFLEAEAFPVIAIGLAIGSITIGLVNNIIALVNEGADEDMVREATRTLFEQFETDGYLHDWGIKIKFLSAYYDNTQKVERSGLQPKYITTRWSPPDVAIFEDEAEAWNSFQRATGTTGERFTIAAKELRSVPEYLKLAVFT